MKKIYIPVTLCLVIAFSGCSQENNKLEEGADQQGHTAPTTITAEANQRVLGELPFSDRQDFDDAMRGLIASDKALKVSNQEGEVIWDQTAYEFIQGESPQSVNPSLWRQAKLNDIHGLFEVCDGVYQLRGFDLANMTIIKGNTGWIIVDPLTAQETAAYALKFARKHLGNAPIRAIIFTHSHVDHFGGVLGIMSAAEVKKNNLRIIAPIGFMEEATSENILAGTIMARRAGYMYGQQLARSERGHVCTGLGKSPAYGKVGILSPTDIIDRTPQEMTIDGVPFIFQNVPGTEAPAELTFYLPQKKAFCGAEIVCRNMHNLYTPRGAKIRDALKWSHDINEAMDMFSDAEVYFGCHHWPIWGNDRFTTFMKQQRDTYKYIHDQTIRLAQSGLTPREIAEQIKMPKALRSVFSSRGYYGTVRHNSRAVYQAYFGWFDGNPANLNPLPPAESGKRYLEFMGGVDNVITRAKTYYEKGEYRWVAEVMNHVVFAEPDNSEARALLARTYDQLGYQAESGPWRDIYLTGAYELRNGTPEKTIDLSNAKDLLMQAPLERFFDAMAGRLNGPDAEDVNMTINFTFMDLDETHALTIENSVLHHRKGAPDRNASATLKITHDLFLKMALKKSKIKDLVFSDELDIDGSRLDLVRFFMLFDNMNTSFNIVTP